MTAQRQQIDIDLNPVFEALERPLALVDSPERRDEMQRFAAASRGYQERAIFDLLAGVTAAVNDANTGAHVSLEYRNGGLALAVDPAQGEATAEEEPVMRMDGDMERLSLRLPAHLKHAIDSAADERGVSVNSWCIRALARSAFSHLHGRRDDEERGSGPEGRPGRGPWRGPRSRIIIDTDAIHFPGPGMFGGGRRGRGRGGPGEFEHGPEGAHHPEHESE